MAGTVTDAVRLPEISRYSGYYHKPPPNNTKTTFTMVDDVPQVSQQVVQMMLL